jgi:hypothetical protein
MQQGEEQHGKHDVVVVVMIMMLHLPQIDAMMTYFT